MLPLVFMRDAIEQFVCLMDYTSSTISCVAIIIVIIVVVIVIVDLSTYGYFSFIEVLATATYTLSKLQ